MNTRERLTVVGRSVLCRHIDIQPDQDLAHHFDSLEKLELILGAEDEFGITIPEESLHGVRTFGQLEKLIDSRRHVS